MEILFENETDYKCDLKDFENIINTALEMENINNNVEVSITVVDNQTIQEINNQYRGFDKATDVLSFPLNSDFDNLDFSHTLPLGDIIISKDKVIEQAEVYGHSQRREISFLVAHSILHLLGYDHMVEDEEKEMFAKQDEILAKLNINR